MTRPTIEIVDRSHEFLGVVIGVFYVKIDGELYRAKNGAIRTYKSRKAAEKAATKATKEPANV